MRKFTLVIIILFLTLFTKANDRQTKLIGNDSCIVYFNLSNQKVELDTTSFKIIKTTVKWDAELSEIYILSNCENNVEFITCLDAENTKWIKYVLYKTPDTIIIRKNYDTKTTY